MVITMLNSFVALSLCIVVGFFSRRRRLLDDNHAKSFSDLLMNITLPCTVFISFMRPFSTELLVESLATFIITGIIFVAGGYIGLFVAKLTKASAGEVQGLRFGSAFGNVAFMGIPIVSAVFGDEGLIYVSMTIASFNLLVFTHGVRMFDNAPKNINLKALIIKTPALPALFLGFIFFVTGIRLPPSLEGGIGMIASMTTPLSMILIGMILAKQRLKDALMDIKMMPPVCVRLVIVPLLSFFILRIFISNPLMLDVIITLMAMPPAAVTVIFAEQYEADGMAAARFVVVSTIVCVVTVPLISLLF